jgi:hypothetical protein
LKGTDLSKPELLVRLRLALQAAFGYIYAVVMRYEAMLGGLVAVS